MLLFIKSKKLRSLKNICPPKMLTKLTKPGGKSVDYRRVLRMERKVMLGTRASAGNHVSRDNIYVPRKIRYEETT